MEVGPSAAPMMPMAAASLKGKKKDANSTVKKMPNWAAAPQRIILGLESSGPKSIIAPMPMKSRMGKASLASMPTSKSH